MQIILTSLTGSLCMVNYLFKKFHSGHSTVVMSFVNWVVLVVHTQKYNTCICIKGMVIISCFPVYFFPLLYVLLVFDWTQQFLPWLFTILMVTHLYRGYGVVHETKLTCIMNSIILLINFHWHYILMYKYALYTAQTIWRLLSGNYHIEDRPPFCVDIAWQKATCVFPWLCKSVVRPELTLAIYN